jgi:hypothetical protein
MTVCGDSPIFFVRECAMVTVAFLCISRSATGMPTMFERPKTTASLPSIVTPLRSSSSIQPCNNAKQSESRNNMDRMVAIKQYLWRAGHMEINIIERPGSTTRRVGFRIGELCNVQGMQSVHIFLLTDAIEDCMLINMRRKGKLD